MPSLGVTSVVSGSGPSPCGVLCPLLTSAFVVLAWALLPGQSLGVLLGEQSSFLCLGLRVNLMSECPTGGVLIRGISNMGRPGKGEVPV